MNRSKRFIAAVITALVTATTVTPVYALSSAPIDVMQRDLAIQRVAENLAGYTPYGSGLIKLPYSRYVGLFRGPKVFDIDNRLCWDETKWVEGGGFDEVRYAEENPDVAAEVGYSHNALWNHFKTVGIAEGRTAQYKHVQQDEYYLCIYQCMVTDAIRMVEEVCNDQMSDWDKAVAVNNEMCAKYSYDVSQNGKRMFYNAGVCDDYANVYKEAMMAIGIPCYRVVNNNHAWNEVYIDGQWYVVDVTWNDCGKDLLLVNSHPYEM